MCVCVCVCVCVEEWGSGYLVGTQFGLSERTDSCMCRSRPRCRICTVAASRRCVRVPSSLPPSHALPLSLRGARGCGCGRVCVLPHSGHTHLHECALRDPTYLEQPLSTHSTTCWEVQYLERAVLLPQDLRRDRDVRAVGIPLLYVVPAESARAVGTHAPLTPQVPNSQTNVCVYPPHSARAPCCIRSGRPGTTWVQMWADLSRSRCRSEQVPAQM